MLGIISAFEEEVKDYLKRRDFRVVAKEDRLRFHQSTSEPEVVVVTGSVGRLQAEMATTLLTQRYRPDRIVSAGFAGGVKAGLSPGDLFVCDRILSIEGPAAFWTAQDAKVSSEGQFAGLDDLIPSPSSFDQQYAICGCLSVPYFISSITMKAWIGANFPVTIIDMESYWVSEAAAASGVPNVVVRSVLDPMEQVLPDFVGDAVEDGSRPGWERAVKHIVSKPAETPKLFRLANQVKVAGESLGKFLAGLATAAA